MWIHHRYQSILTRITVGMSFLLFFSCQKNIGNVDMQPSNPREPGDKPNIILILADDIGYEIPGYTGGQSYSTPSIDALAKSGIRFTQCQVSPNCSPTRVELLTGKYGFRNYTAWGSLDPGEKTIANMLHDAGYRTCVAGKWQLGGGDASIHGFGFDKYRVFEPFYLADEHDENRRRYKNPHLYEHGGYLPDTFTKNKYADNLFLDYICDFIDSNLSSPFFIYFSLSLCHKPFSPTPDDPEFAAWDPLINTSDAAFFPSMVRYMDKKVKQLTDKINAAGLARNTIIVFLGDNGTPQELTSQYQGKTIQGGKNTSTIYGTHVPLVVSWPGTIAANQSSETLVSAADFLPALADAAGIKQPPDYGTLDGISFYPSWFGEKKRWRDWIYFYWHPQLNDPFAKVWVQDETYKLYDSTYDHSFFDIATDPLEADKIPGNRLTPGEKARKETFESVLHAMH